ncbi:MAG: DUF1634 domain-containing protein [Thermoguttaceae bacterium]
MTNLRTAMLPRIATPISRVAVSTPGSALQRDRAYAVICAVVFAALVISSLLGKVEMS